MSFDSFTFFILYSCVFFFSVSLRYKAPQALAPILLIASILCYTLAGWGDLALIFTVLVVNYSLSFHARDKRFLFLAIVFNILCLAFFKYRAFLLGEFDIYKDLFSSQIIIPLGISFYIFQIIAYQVDLYRQKTMLISSFPRFSLFIIFFPQLIAGPIVRANQLRPQLDRFWDIHPPTHRLYNYGLILCLSGLSKKILFADSLAPFVDQAFAFLPINAWAAWQGAVLFGFQVYFDFSGYSDIAVGMAYLLGIRLPNNFRTPYLSTSPAEFWHRWHITLSRWIRDYLYIPLGGSRQSNITQQLIILLFVMALAGLWHGANWTFILWGLGWGFYTVFVRLLRKLPLNTHRIKPLLFIPHLTVVFILWVWFRAPTAEFAWHYTLLMFSLDNVTSLQRDVWPFIGILCGFMFLHSLERYADRPQVLWRLRHWNKPFFWAFLATLCFWLIMIPKTSVNPFIYFRF